MRVSRKARFGRQIASSNRSIRAQEPRRSSNTAVTFVRLSQTAHRGMTVTRAPTENHATLTNRYVAHRHYRDLSSYGTASLVASEAAASRRSIPTEAGGTKGQG